MPILTTARFGGDRSRQARAASAAIAALALSVALFAPMAVSGPATAADGDISTSGLTTNGRVDPLGVTADAPIFAFKSTSTGRGVMQSAYRIRVAEGENTPGSSTVWDSGKVDSDQQLDIPYGGPALESQSRYSWQVKVWDDRGNESDWSETARFETGIFDESEWKADWIGAPDPAAQAAEWTDYTVEVDFTPTADKTFGLYLRSSADFADTYMWQLNDSDSEHPMLRPHVRIENNWRVLEEIDLTEKGLPADVLAHRGTLDIELDGARITTTLNGVVVDSRTDSSHSSGFAGLRTDVKNEEVLIHSMSVTSPTATLYASNFAGGENPFNAGTIIPGADGGLKVSGFVNALYTPSTSLPLLRTGFETDDGKHVASARLFASARGIYELSLNGEKVGDQELAPGWTDFTQRIQYQSYDVTELVRSGENAFGAMLGDGWYAGYIAWFGNHKYGEQTSVIAQLAIEYTDGSTQLVSTDSGWTTHPGPIRSADLQMGEDYDARLEVDGWNEPGFDDAAWSPVVIADSATGRLVSQTDEPVRTTQNVPAITQSEMPAGVHIYDLGQNLSGVGRMTLTGTAGETATIRYAEVLNKDGSLYVDNLRSAKATDHYTFGEDGTVVFRPRFTQHGFRYIEVSGLAEAPAVGDISADVFGSDLEATGTFETSDTMLNQLQSNIVWGQRSNFISVPTDTPARDERLGYSGDLLAFAPTAAFNQDAKEFVKKWLQDMRDTQLPDGEFPESAPRGPGQGCCDGGTAWSDGGVLIPWMMWERYGDTDLIRDHYASMEEYFGYLEANFPTRIRNHGPYGDWLHLGDDTPPEVLGTAYYAYMARAMSEMADAIGKDADATRYSEMATEITELFQREFVADDGAVEGGSQTAYALAIGMDLVPAELVAAAGDKLVAKVASRDYHLSTGFVGTPWLLPALSRSGNWDVAYRLLMNKTIPSWGYEVESGATTMWERWDSIDADGNFGAASMNSFNHYAFGAVGDWMYQNIGGIAVGETGYKSTVISPHPGGGLTSAAASLETPYGLVATDWKISDGELSLSVTVPTNATATVHIPASNTWAVTEGASSLADAAGVHVLSSEGDVVSVRVGSGSYEFGVSALAEQFGAVIESSTDLQDELDALEGLDRGDAVHVDRALRIIVDAMGHGIGVLDSDRTAAVADVLDALAEIRELADWIDDSDIGADARAQLVEDTRAIEAQLDALAAELSGVTVVVDAGVPAAVLPGQPLTVTALLTNTGTEELTELSAKLELGEPWAVDPASSPLVPSLPAGESVAATFTTTVPDSQLPGEVTLPVAVGYDYQGVTLRGEGETVVTVESGVVLTAVTADPASVLPNSKTLVTVTLENKGALPVSGATSVAPPGGWAAVSSPETVIAPGETATVAVELFVPTTLDEQALAIPVEFAHGDTVLATGRASIEAIVPAPGADEMVLDHIDLGDAASEAAHGLTASPSSGTSVEAGATRRYSGNAASSYFSFAMAVPKNAPFIIRAVETYDGARLKEYSVLVDGVEVQSRLFQRVTTGYGTDNYQILVDDAAAFSTTGSATITMRHADSTTNYDPSIADAWILPAGADVLAPTVSAVVTRSGSAEAGEWSPGPVTVELSAADDVREGLEIEYRLDTSADWSPYSEPVTVTAQGEHGIEYRATDAAGNESAVGTSEFAIDSIAPGVWGWLSDAGELVSVASDATAGIDRVEYSVDGTHWVEGAETLMSDGELPDTVHARARDLAGNASETIRLDPAATAPTLTVAPGDALAIEATGFAAGAVIRVELHSEVTVLGTVTANNAGVVTLDTRLPSSVAEGEHELVFVVLGDDGGDTGGDDNGGGDGDTPVTIPVDVIASTGFHALPFVLGAGVLLLLGAGILLWRRRRATSGRPGE
ncbi:MAG: family 78 glycoside hydrolase catalytic domain [Actinomycetota bacterium]|nr:family 78 glycoside hydrolase catalytic domain [Actinomycetota bacterium]